MKKKNRVITIAIVILFLFLFTILFRDLGKISEQVSLNQQMNIFHTKMEIVDGEPSGNLQHYYFSPDDASIVQIKEIMSDYSYHRSFNIFSNVHKSNSNDDSDFYIIHSGDEMITLYRLGRMVIDEKLYTIKPIVNKQKTELFKAISEFLNDYDPVN